jgi:hypothetical protein
VAPTYTYDIELLKQLIGQYPDWTYPQYAAALTADMRRKLGDSYHEIPANTVALAIQRLRFRAGMSIPERPPSGRCDLVPWPLAPEYRMHAYIRKLRLIDRLRKGGDWPRANEAEQARNLEMYLFDSRQLVDLGRSGEPIIRAAYPAELNDDGTLKEIVAQPGPVPVA